MSLLRLVSLLLDGYLVVTTVAGATARAARCARAVRALDLVSPASVRRVLAASVGGLVLSFPIAAQAERPVVRTAPAPSFLSRSNSVVLAPVDAGPPLVRISPPNPADAAGGSRPRQPYATEATADPPVVPARPSALAANLPPLSNAAPTSTWTVRPGDNFWLIARLLLSAKNGRPATPAETARFWAALVNANRDRLMTGNASLIYAGQRFVIPAA
jgi:nucleoid-associated protein YgaU